MSQAIVEAVRVKYPTPLGAEHGAFLIDLARTLGGGAGLLAKDWGTFVRLPDGRGVAQDIVCYRVGEGATHFDVLADGEGVAEPRWHEVGPIDPARYVDVGGAPQPEPVPVPDPVTPVPVPGTCKAVESMAEVLDALHEMRIEQAERDEAIRTLLYRLINAERMPRRLTGRASWMSLSGEVDGVEP